MIPLLGDSLCRALQKGVEEATNSSSVKVIIDVNPDFVANAHAMIKSVRAEMRPQQRYKYLSERGIQYFAVSDVNNGDQLGDVVFDYAATNLGVADKFVLVCDRVPSNLTNLLGGLENQFAKFFSK
ncbi:MAG: hypothetical protein U5N10_12695 [Gemmobacter sp.]|nr:hypothetical protein [Gemmobacter sp.]